MNVGICSSGESFVVIATGINWTLVDRPREYNWAYLPGHSSGKVDLVLLEVDRDFRVVFSAKLDQPHDMPPPQSRAEIGFGDPRLFIWRRDLWCVAPVRQLNPDALTEMALVRVNRTQPDRYVLSDWRVVPSGKPPQLEKNWMPQVDGDELRLIYSVDPRVLTDTGAELTNEPAPIVADGFRGGSQAVSFDGGWLMVVHEHEHVDGKRRYFHRFIWLDTANRLRRLSHPFYLRKLGIEFVAGMAWHPDGEHLVISFNVHDRDQFLAVVKADDVCRFLLEIAQNKQATQKVIAEGEMALEIIKQGDGKIAEVINDEKRPLFQ